MIGETLAHYIVESELGHGGMGVVYRARDRQLGRMVALKVLAAEHLGDKRRRQRLLREARAAASLNHPNIVAIYEVGTDRNVDYIAMEYVEGTPLSLLLRDGRLPAAKALYYGCQVAAALGKAHAAGIIHRDLKPANAIVTADNLVKLLDFGIAKVSLDSEDVDADTVSQLTETGIVLGTPAYMSPEQLRGEELDGRSDIFSFGVLLYELLAGVRPFRGESRVRLIDDVLHGTPPSLEKACGDLPAGLAALVNKCLMKDRNVRYGSFAPVLSAMRGMLRTMDAEMPPTQSPDSVTGTRVVERRWGRYGLVAVAAVVVTASAYSVQPLRRYVFQRFRNSRLATAMRLPSPVAEHVREGHLYLYRFDRAGSVDKALEAFQAGIEAERRNPAAYAGLGLAYAQKYVDNPDPQYLRMADTNARQAVELNPFLAVAHVSMGRVYLAGGRWEEAEKQLRRALELEPGNADASLYLGSTLYRSGRGTQAEQLFRKMTAEHPSDWRAYQYLGALLNAEGRTEEAAAALTNSGELAPDNIAVYKMQSVVLIALDRLPEAAQVLQKALAIQGSTGLLTNLGDVYFKSGRFADAADAFQQVVAKAGNDYRNWGNLGDALRMMPGKQAQAQQSYEQAIQLVNEELERSPANTRLHAFRALYLASCGKGAAAGADLDAVSADPKADSQALFLAGVASEISRRRDLALRLIGDALRARYPLHEVRNNPDLVNLRADARFRSQVLRNVATGANKPSP